MIRLAAECMILVMTVGSWILMLTKGGQNLLSSRGAASLKYYTTLSNLYAGLSAAVNILLMLVNGTDSQLPMWAAMLKYSAAVSVCVTFLVTAVFLAPQYGFGAMFGKELLFLHGVGPIAEILSFFLTGNLPEMGPGASFAAVLPTVVYAVYYVGNILRNGIGEGADTNDWYGFLKGRKENIPAAVIAILSGTWVLAWIFWLIRF